MSNNAPYPDLLKNIFEMKPIASIQDVNPNEERFEDLTGDPFDIPGGAEAMEKILRLERNDSDESRYWVATMSLPTVTGYANWDGTQGKFKDRVGGEFIFHPDCLFAQSLFNMAQRVAIDEFGSTKDVISPFHSGSFRRKKTVPIAKALECKSYSGFNGVMYFFGKSDGVGQTQMIDVKEAEVNPSSVKSGAIVRASFQMYTTRKEGHRVIIKCVALQYLGQGPKTLATSGPPVDAKKVLSQDNAFDAGDYMKTLGMDGVQLQSGETKAEEKEVKAGSKKSFI